MVRVWQEKITKAYVVKEYIMQILLYFTMFNLIPFAVSASIYLNSGVSLTENIVNLAVFAVSSALFICTFLLFFCNPDPFDYFRYSFKKHRLLLLYYHGYALVIVATVAITVLVRSVLWAAAIPCGVLLLFVIIVRPYK